MQNRREHREEVQRQREKQIEETKQRRAVFFQFFNEKYQI